MQQPVDHGLSAAKLDTGNTAFARSRVWGDIVTAFTSRPENATCAACHRDNTQAKLEVHHKLPFHLCRDFQRPDLEFNPDNLMTLCEVHHLYIGHLGSWQSFNENVESDVKDTSKQPPWATFFEKVSFIEDLMWKSFEVGRPKPYNEWDNPPPFRQHFADLIAQRFGATPPQESLSQLIFQWYGKQYSESEITNTVNTDLGTGTSPTGGS
jgi:hypothetical protein